MVDIHIDLKEATAEAESARQRMDASQIRISHILEMIDNPEESLIEINRQIAIEIAHISSEISRCAVEPALSYRIRSLEIQIKALRELSKTLMESETLSKRDTLNFDGPKFTYVLSEIIKLFKKAMQQNQLGEDQINGVLRIYRDLLAVYEPSLRKETERQTSNK